MDSDDLDGDGASGGAESEEEDDAAPLPFKRREISTGQGVASKKAHTAKGKAAEKAKVRRRSPPTSSLPFARSCKRLNFASLWNLAHQHIAEGQTGQADPSRSRRRG